MHIRGLPPCLYAPNLTSFYIDSIFTVPKDLDTSDPILRRRSIALVTILCHWYFFLITPVGCPGQSNGVGVAAIEGCQIVWDHVIDYINNTLALSNLVRLKNGK